MSEHVYKIVELVGSSTSSIEDAIQTAIRRADQSLRNLRWFEVVQTRGQVENGEVQHYQVVLKAGLPSVRRGANTLHPDSYSVGLRSLGLSS
jgi:flavin-binding protein dodecin